ncbi:MAG TPA: prepilin-type N-terminal cleavage/methylation domain-containing protein [Phycisphaerae bacterium]|jgi:prepilin-type N-terminal cleavage/methylation domain-containing protein/prepilin-type processing-associated H-X9-DG protein
MKFSRITRGGFTLIELLVVVAIIALLIAILLPSLGRARKQAKNVTCLANLKSDGTALYNYATQNNGKLPADGLMEGQLFWDMEANLTDFVMGDNGIVRKTYYCPLNLQQNVPNLWNLSGAVGAAATHRALGYFYILQRNNLSINGLKLPKFAKSKVTSSAMAEDGELITDIVISDAAGQVFDSLPFSGGGGVNLGTSHMADTKPSGGNILFLDGHADVRKYSQMKLQIRSSDVGASDPFIEYF